ncbi:hypothetical protein GII30_04565 [Gordonia amarae]|uniref:Uncharacterized protein n=2 Tax=Gordonia amarae TaxID=36821 RepID=A0A857KU63_9ACTN|nr:carboxymuconolactone decarboxylase family protein [Gordonia amarae]MCS3877637.1 alkylhydroperoxidase/carboxymuconolactone decarboxylase family protein YurZ [Gordonia amarae]QHN16349.1 hypothetical protein GII35_04570 [Gordonia amarae]QHN20918.1 hypothetical protein GII34_04570 [Gordonia amarae]QHN29769.1 hypothetical protein GII32_04575 [Gordonia amarae]QHN38544.1 hypothetical protein GII30_04565 [Gordonia amarae]
MTDTAQAADTLSRYDQAAQVLDSIFGPAWREKQKETGFKAVDDFQRIAVESCYADVWSRDTLDYKTRSAICLSILATRGSHEEFKMHVEAALANGWTHEEIFEIVLNFIPYIGVPKSMQALKVAGATFKELFERDVAAAEAN